MIRLLVGLGNPGPEYAATRHNAGFWFIDEAARKLGATLVPDRAYSGRVARVNVRGQAVWLLQPTTYMNLSGKSVAPLARFFKIEPAEILVAHDELDLLPGLAKLKLGGGNAGHNGLKDINAQLGSADFWRLRLGIGHPGVKAEVVDYVLRKPPLSERELIDKSIEQSLGGLDAMLAGDMAQAGLVIHARPPRPKPPRPPREAAVPADARPGSPAFPREGAGPLSGAAPEGRAGATAGPASATLDRRLDEDDGSP
ncbi:aminoacyl-tRNA hydrolase [Schlegelella koreensis]|uniref:Peptidyl-tRNA hydrolase n=1 Tax=Piscinibacter koreensis TaxID=2742824 RepID=A0A7Y6TWZ1_9BURK|nr:aminoacyl-tRNA hydrolase [Schlegelella koreensis]